MSIWEDNDLTVKIVDLLSRVPIDNAASHLGRPFVSAYQLAIGLRRHYGDTFDAINKRVGGEGIGLPNSLAQYLGGELSRRINAEGNAFPVEVAFLSRSYMRSVTFRDPSDGADIESSLIGAGYDMSIFRLRHQ